MTSLIIGTLVGVFALAACDRQGPMPTAPYPPPVASLDKTEESTTEPPDTGDETETEAVAVTETDTETETTATRAKPLTRPNSPDKPMTRSDEPTAGAPNTAPTPAGGPTEN